jgi:uncharacterized membrane protein
VTWRLPLAGAMLALVCGSAALWLDGPFNSVGGLALVLVLPGAAFVGAIRLNVTCAERIMLSVGLSISISILGGLMLDLVGRQGRTAWAVWLVAATFAGLAVAALRRDPSRPASPWAELGTALRANVTTLAAAGAAAAIAAVGVAVAARSDHNNSGPDFTQLSLRPTGNAPHESWIIQIANHEAKAHRYVVTVKANGQPSATSSTPVVPPAGIHRLRVAWRHPSATGSIRVTLRRDDDSGTYRRVSAWGP